jgi:hypothetical protein
MSDDLTPLEVCERLIGPIPMLASICGYVDTAPYGWRRASKTRGNGDLPGAPVMRKLLEHAARHGLGLTARHLICGATTDEIAAILAARQVQQVAA